MQADVPVACYLSGGIDSSSVLALMTRCTNRSIPAFSLSFEDRDFDESPLVRTFAKQIGANLTEVNVTQASLADDFNEAIWHCETLIGNANSVAKFALSRAVQQAGYRVVLTGEGSDELFAGYQNFVADSVRNGSETEREALRQALGMTSAEFQRILCPVESLATVPGFAKRLGYVPLWIEGRQKMLQASEHIFDDSLRKVDTCSRLLENLDVLGQLKGRSVLDQSLYIQVKTVFPGSTLSTLADRVEMAHSVEGRPPFLDPHVVDFARRLPGSQKIRGLAEKFVLRKAMKAILPPDVCGRRKRGLLAPSAFSGAGTPLSTFMQDTLRGQALKRIPFLNRDEVIGMLDGLANFNGSTRVALEISLTLVASACVLSERFGL
jgi:asparagine synthase (glutamine-hydrolysing)